jgi:hypothetical protein
MGYYAAPVISKTRPSMRVPYASSPAGSLSALQLSMRRSTHEVGSTSARGEWRIRPQGRWYPSSLLVRLHGGAQLWIWQTKWKFMEQERARVTGGISTDHRGPVAWVQLGE